MRPIIDSLPIKKYFKYALITFALLICVAVVWLLRLNSTMQKRIENGWFRPPVEIYSRGEQISTEQNLNRDQLKNTLIQLRFRERGEEQSLHPQDFALLDSAQCSEMLKDSFLDEVDHCIYIRAPLNSNQFYSQPESRTSNDFIVGFNDNNQVKALFSGPPFQNVESIELSPMLFAQFYGGEPILQNIVPIGEIPVECLQAATAIEDSQFLEHKGVSFTGLGRALIRNLVAGRYAQGGSTITQQLVKNYFLTPEKTMKRKISELFMAILLEANLDKDKILENYLNVIYMGQRGPFQIIGFSSASDYYFNKPIGSLNLAECSLLAAIINSPGRYNPFTQPQKSLERRNSVLDRMVETQMISAEQANLAKKQELPKTPALRMLEPAPYYTQAVFRELDKLGIDKDQGLKIYTALDVEAQDFAQKKVLEHVQNLEKSHKAIIKNKENGKNLEASLISVDVKSGEVIALVGGRQYIKTQYNRVLDAHRQVGSIMKPFVYLAALENLDENDQAYMPLTIVHDKKFVHKYEGQSWSPQNYTKEFYGDVPLFYALKNSLNAATAQVGLQVGLESIIDVARRAGMTSEMQPFPSLTLGAFEIYQWEVSESMLTLARMGEKIPLTFIRTVEELNGERIYAHTIETEQVFAPESIAKLVGMMKLTVVTGTARLAKILGFDRPAAGKTGTTSDTKDTWFAGFTPHILTVTWTGYDDNTETKLTGASGALPLWIEYMKKIATRYPASDFNWPDGVSKHELSPSEYLKLVPMAESYELENQTELIW